MIVGCLDQNVFISPGFSFGVPFRYDGTERNGFEERSVGDGTEIRIVPSDFRRVHVAVVFSPTGRSRRTRSKRICISRW